MARGNAQCCHPVRRPAGDRCPCASLGSRGPGRPVGVLRGELGRYGSRALPRRRSFFTGAGPDGRGTPPRPPAAAEDRTGPGEGIRGDTTGSNGQRSSSRSRLPLCSLYALRPGPPGPQDVGAFIDRGLAVRAQRAGYRWFTHDPSYRAWAVLAAEAAADAGSSPGPCPACRCGSSSYSGTAHQSSGWTSPSCSVAAAAMPRGGRPVQPCRRRCPHGDLPGPGPARYHRAGREHSCGNRTWPRQGTVRTGRDVAAGINDDAARLLAVHADLASHASLPVHDRPRVAVRRPGHRGSCMHVTDTRIIRTRRSQVPPPACIPPPGSPQPPAGTTRTG